MTSSRPSPKALAAARGAARKPTLKTISQLSGLAVATVSRALNDAPDIGADTKKLVRRIASEIGYVPNRAGVRLRTGKTNVISLIMSTEHDMMNHTARLISSVASALRDTRFHLIITPFFPDQDPMDPVRYVVESGSADAVILNQTRPQDPRVKYLLEKGFPFATHGRTDLGVEHPYYDFDNNAFGRIGVRKLARRGCRSIVLIAPPRGQSYAEHMVEGATAEAAALGLALRVEELTTSDSPSAQVRECVARRLGETPEVDGYICASTTSAMAVVAAAEEMGRVLGRDLNVYTKEAVRFLNLFRKEIIAISEDVGRAGTFVAQAAVQAIREPDKPPMQELEVPEDDGT